MLNTRRIFGWFAALAFLYAAVSARAQLHANGFLDTTFSAPCFANPVVSFAPRALLVQTDGRILVGGEFAVPLACANGLARLRTNGTQDGSFLAPLVPGDFVTGIATQSNGKIIISGRLTLSGGAFPVARLGANGSSDGAFLHLNDPLLVAKALAVQSDDKVMLVGTYNNSQGFVFRLKANGALDDTFTNRIATEAVSGERTVNAVALQSSKVVVGGRFSFYDDGVVYTNRDGLARLNFNGTLDVVFHPAISDADVRALLVQPDGKIFVAGRFQADGQNDICLTRLNANGTRDTTFTSLNGLGITALALTLQDDGKILVGHTLGVMRVTTNGVVDDTFGPLNAPGSFGTDAAFAAALAHTLDGNLLVGATRVGVSGTERRGVARLFANLPPPPVITQQPLTQIVEAGMNATFSVIATGAPPIMFQWRKGGVNIPGATNDTLLLNNVHSPDTANYTVVAANPGGSVTSELARLIVNFHTSPLYVTTNGLGVILPKLTGAEFEIGRTFTLTAQPIVGNLFSNWTGGVTSSSPVLTFVMQSNLALVVNFVPSPFIPVRGVYNGLFYDTNTPAHVNAGALTLTLDDTGAIKGSLRRGTRVRKIAGTFSIQRTVALNLPATAADPALAVTMELDTAAAAIHGTVTLGTNVWTLLALRTPFSTKLNPAPNFGNYNAALPGEDNPTGDGFAALTVSTAGRVSGRGVLADGSALNVLSATSAGARVPVYVPLYAGRGSIFGWLTVTNDASNDVSGTLWWTKPGAVGGVLYSAGFSNRIEVVGSRYTAVPARTPVLTLTNGVVVLTGGNLTNDLAESITLGGDNKIADGNGLALTFTPTKGSLAGTFVDPASGAKRKVRGVVLPKQNQARGFFLGTNRSGRVFIGE